jgi:hypothetical protein
VAHLRLYSVFDYAKTAATALKLLTKFGQPMTVSKEVYDIDTGLLVSATDIIGMGVIFAISDGVSSMSNGLIKASDQQVLIGVQTIPAPIDRLTVGDKVYSIVDVKALEPAGVNVLYELIVRK